MIEGPTSAPPDGSLTGRQAGSYNVPVQRVASDAAFVRWGDERLLFSFRGPKNIGLVSEPPSAEARHN